MTVYTARQNDSAIAVFGKSLNQIPLLVNEILDQEATKNSVFNFTVPVDTFSDAY
ncbi:MAG: hypothetical protein ACYTXC_26750 [Nostoc sp.]